MRRILQVGFICGFLSSVFLAAVPLANGSQDGSRKERLAIASPAKQLGLYLFGRAETPDFALQELSGKEVALSESRGKVVLLNFWTTY